MSKNEHPMDASEYYEDDMMTYSNIPIVPIVLYNVPVRANSLRHMATVIVDEIFLFHHKDGLNDSYNFVGKVVENGLTVWGIPVDGYTPIPAHCEWRLETGALIPEEWRRNPTPAAPVDSTQEEETE